MNDLYLGVAEHIKKMLEEESAVEIADELQDQVTFSFDTHSHLNDIITNIFQTIAKQKSELKIHTDSTPFEILVINEDERYLNCSESYKSSKQIIDQMFVSRHCKFDLKDKNENVIPLNKNERDAANTAGIIRHTKKELIGLMSTNQLTFSLVLVLITQYLQNVLKQIRCECFLYEKEAELGTQFSRYVKGLVEKHYSTIKHSSFTNPEINQTILRAYSVLCTQKNLDPNVISKLTVATIKQGMDEFRNHLDNRRKQFDILQNVASVVEKIVVQLDELNSEPNQSKKDSEPIKNRKSFRMAITSKLLNRFGKKRNS